MGNNCAASTAPLLQSAHRCGDTPAGHDLQNIWGFTILGVPYGGPYFQGILLFGGPYWAPLFS